MPLAIVVVANGRLWRSITCRSSSGLRHAHRRRAEHGDRPLGLGDQFAGLGDGGVGRRQDLRQRLHRRGVVLRAGASATSSGRSRCTGPRGSLMAMRIASFTVSAILPFSSRNDALVIGLNSA